MPVSSTHPDYDRALQRSTAARDAVSGSDAVKSKREAYLPGFIPADKERYDQYIKRAVYVNVVGRTLQGLIGCIFRRPHSLELPSSIEFMEDDADGNGSSIEQLSKSAAAEIMQAGRVGLFVDYPDVEPGLSAEEITKIGARPVIRIYPSESIINWGPDLFVLMENVGKPIDEFTSESEKQYRVLDVFEGKFRVRLFNQDEQVVGETFPRMSSGEFWPVIPFVICGADSNSGNADIPPLYSLAEVNLAHYRNSADYEEGVYIHGQGTLFVSSDMSGDQFNAANPSGVKVGARTGHFLGANGNAILLQMKDNSAALEAMKQKEAQMLAIGAKLITGKTGTQTAEAARIEASSEASALDTIVGNLSDAIEECLEYSAAYVSGYEEVKFSLNREFYDQGLTAQEVIAMIQLLDRGLVAKVDARGKLRSAGYIAANRTDDEIDEDAEEVSLDE